MEGGSTRKKASTPTLWGELLRISEPSLTQLSRPMTLGHFTFVESGRPRQITRRTGSSRGREEGREGRGRRVYSARKSIRRNGNRGLLKSTRRWTLTRRRTGLGNTNRGQLICRGTKRASDDDAKLQQEQWQMQQQLDVREQHLVSQRDLQVTELRARLGEETTDVRDATT